MSIKIEFKLEDFWIGVFWKRTWFTDSMELRAKMGHEVAQLDIWICLIPCFPIHLTKIG